MSIFGNKNRHKDVIKWIKRSGAMVGDNYTMLIRMKDTDHEGYMKIISDFKVLMEEEQNLESFLKKNYPSGIKRAKKFKGVDAKEYLKMLRLEFEKVKEQSKQQSGQKKKPFDDFKRKAEKEKTSLYIEIKKEKEEFRKYTKEVVPVQVALEEERLKIESMTSEVREVATKQVKVANLIDVIKNGANEVLSKDIPKTVNQANAILSTLDEGHKHYSELKNSKEELLASWNDARKIKSRTDSVFTKVKDSIAITARTLFVGSKKRDFIKEVKINTGGY